MSTLCLVLLNPSEAPIHEYVSVSAQRADFTLWLNQWLSFIRIISVPFIMVILGVGFPPTKQLSCKLVCS